MWSGRRLLLFHPHCAGAAKEPFTFHQALAPGGRAAGATGMNQWMPCRPGGARPGEHGGGEDGRMVAYWAARHPTGLGRLGIPRAGRGAPRSALPPLPGWRRLARARGAHCAGSWHQLGKGISITKSRSERGAARRGLCGAPGARRSRAVTRTGAARPATVGVAGPAPPLAPAWTRVPAARRKQWVWVCRCQREWECVCTSACVRVYRGVRATVSVDMQCGVTGPPMPLCLFLRRKRGRNHRFSTLDAPQKPRGAFAAHADPHPPRASPCKWPPSPAA